MMLSAIKSDAVVQVCLFPSRQVHLPYFHDSTKERLPLSSVSDYARRQYELQQIMGVFVVGAAAVTIALLVAIVFGGEQVHLVTVGQTPIDRSMIEHSIVASPVPECTTYAHELLHEHGGNAVDAQVAALLCLSVAMPHMSPIVNGGVMLLHDQRTHESVVYDFDANPPEGAHEDDMSSGSSVGVPTALRALYAIHEKRGRLTWHKLFDSALRMARGGMTVSSDLVTTFKKASEASEKPNDTKGGDFSTKFDKLAVGDTLRQPKLANLLASLADDFEETFAPEVVDAVGEAGGNMSMSDLLSAVVTQSKPITTKLTATYRIETTGSNTAGNVLLFVMREMAAFDHEHPKATHKERTDMYKKTMRLAISSLPKLSETPRLFGKSLSTSTLASLSNSTTSSFSTTSPTLSVTTIDRDDIMIVTSIDVHAPFGRGVMTKSGLVLNDQLSAPKLRLSAPVIVLDEKRPCNARAAIGVYGTALDGFNVMTSVLSHILRSSRMLDYIVLNALSHSQTAVDLCDAEECKVELLGSTRARMSVAYRREAETEGFGDLGEKAVEF